MSSSTSLALAHLFTLILFKICCDGASQFQNINQALGFYGVYHQDPINQLIHFIGVPIIIWSMTLFLVHLKLPLVSISINCLPGIPPHTMTYGTIAMMGYILFYLTLDWFGGMLYAPFAYMQYATAVSMMTRDQNEARQARRKLYKSQSMNGKVDSEKDDTRMTTWTGTGHVLKIAFVLHFLGWYAQIHPGKGDFFLFSTLPFCI